MRRTHPGEMGGPYPLPNWAAAGPPLSRAQLCSSSPQVPLRALPAVPRHAVVPHQHGLLGGARAPPTSSRVSPVSDGRAGPACGCVSVRQAGGWTDRRRCCGIAQCVCVLKAAVRPLEPCPACPAARAPCRDGGEGRELSTYPLGTLWLPGLTPCVGSGRSAGPCPTPGLLLLHFPPRPDPFQMFRFFWCVLPFFASTLQPVPIKPLTHPILSPSPKISAAKLWLLVWMRSPVSSSLWLGRQRCPGKASGCGNGSSRALQSCWVLDSLTGGRQWGGWELVLVLTPLPRAPPTWVKCCQQH